MGRAFRGLSAGEGADRRKVLVLLFAAVAFLALAAIGLSALGGQVDAAGRPFSLTLVPRVRPAVASGILAVLLIAVAAIGALCFAFLRDRIREEIRREGTLQRSAFPRAAALIVLAPLLTAAVAILVFFVVANQQQAEVSYAERIDMRLAAVDQAAQEGRLQDLESQARRQEIRRFLPLMVGGVVGVVFVAILLFSDRIAHAAAEEKRRESRITRELKRDLAQAAGLALDDIAAEPDNRAAAIACYARLEVVLDMHSLPRAPYQTPMEYMHSVLEEGPGLPEAALLDLTRIYELAEFSTHEITRAHKASALALLGDIRGFLVRQLDAAAEVGASAGKRAPR